METTVTDEKVKRQCESIKNAGLNFYNEEYHL
jgi:hypothetical protein